MKQCFKVIAPLFLTALLLTVQLVPAALAQTVTGLVEDNLGESLPGVNILVKGTTTGTSTNTNGSYRLTVSSLNDTLVFSFVGFQTQEIPINGRTEIDVVMQPQALLGGEVLVVGYGTQRRKDLTGSVATVSAGTIEDAPVSNFTDALSGQLAGVQIRSGTGIPGGGPSLEIRGVSSIGAGSEPLYIVDGYPVGNVGNQFSNPLSVIPPEDIESVSVLKDAASIGIYGARANNGLVIITTKRGVTGKPSITFNTSTGVQVVPGYEYPDIMNAQEFAQFKRESFRDNFLVSNGREPDESEIPETLRNPSQYGEGTDWYDEITKSGALQQRYNMAVRGGVESFTYNISGEFFDQEGLLLDTGFKRYSFRTNIDIDVTEKIKFGLSLSPTRLEQKGGRTDPGGGGFEVYGAVNISRWSSPEAPVRDENGELVPLTRSVLTPFFQTNPVLLLQDQDNQINTNRLILNSSLEFDPIPNVNIKTTFGTDLTNVQDDFFKPSTIAPFGLIPNPAAANTIARATERSSTNWLNENTVTYQNTFDESHSIEALAGFSAQHNKFESSTVTGSDFPDDDIRIPAGAPTITGGAGASEWSLLSVFGRVNYSYKDKYFISGVFRRDGSSRFGRDNKYGNFPSISTGWRIAEEPFMDRWEGTLSELKLKASYGITGNNQIGDFASLGVVGGDNYVFGDQFAPGRFVSTIPFTGLTWEETTLIDVGLEVGLWDDRIFMTAEWYQKDTENFLFSLPIPLVSGYGGSLDNVGKVRNRGLEVAIKSQNMTRRDFQWSTDFNISFNRNEVLSISPDVDEILRGPAGNGTRFSVTRVGEPIGMYFGLKILGLYTQAEIDDPNVPKYPGAVEGALKVLDGNGNGIFEGEADHVIIGNPHPDFIYGITNNFSYKNFDLQVIMSGAYGQEIYDFTRQFNHNTDGVFNVSTEQFDRFRPGDDPTEKTVPTTVGAPNRRRWRGPSPNSETIKDASYLSVRNITLSHTLSPDLLSRTGILRNARVFLSIQNAFMFSPFDGNPEVQRAADGDLVRNVNYGNYPVPRIFTIGTNLTF